LSETQPAVSYEYRVVIAEPELMEGLCGKQLHPDIYDIKPFGNRMVLVREKPKSFSATCQACGKRNLTSDQDGKCAYCGQSGLIALEIPTQARDLPSIGWVVSVGPEVHLANFPRTVPLSQDQLVGCKVLFAPYGGHTLNVGDVGETLYEGSYLLIEATQVLALVGDMAEGGG
jgi:co-chaperonin GroES (HSP10)